MTELPGRGQDELRLVTVEGEISALKSALEKRDSPWNSAVIISLIALLFSFGTTAASYFRERNQDMHDSRAELRALVQRLDRIPVENIEYFKKYSEDQATAMGISSALNSENALVAKQAYEVINLIPSNVESTEYYSVGFALQNSALFDKAAKMYKAGIEVSYDMNDEVALRRNLAGLDFMTGFPKDGRAQFEQALNIFDKYPSTNSYLVESTKFLTEIQWAAAEVSVRECGFAKEHFASAEKHLSSVRAIGNSSPYEAQYNGFKSSVENCTP